MPDINPMGWARMSAGKAFLDKESSEENRICTKLNELFVEKMGIAKQVSLETDPITGSQIIQFQMKSGSAIPTGLIGTQVRGIPIKFTESNSIS